MQKNSKKKNPKLPQEMDCQFKGCTKKATLALRLLLKESEGIVIAVTTPVSYCCEEHSINLKIEDVCDWNNICLHFLTNNLAAPRKMFSTVFTTEIPVDPNLN